MKCDRCHGAGRTSEGYCWRCGGTGNAPNSLASNSIDWPAKLVALAVGAGIVAALYWLLR